MPELPVSADALSSDFQRYLNYHLGRNTGSTPHYIYEALALTVRDRLMSD